MKRAGKARRGIYMSDGTINLALLRRGSDEEKSGIYHFGMWVDDLDDTEKSRRSRRRILGGAAEFA